MGLAGVGLSGDKMEEARERDLEMAGPGTKLRAEPWHGLSACTLLQRILCLGFGAHRTRVPAWPSRVVIQEH